MGDAALLQRALKVGPGSLRHTQREPVVALFIAQGAHNIIFHERLSERLAFSRSASKLRNTIAVAAISRRRLGRGVRIEPLLTTFGIAATRAGQEHREPLFRRQVAAKLRLVEIGTQEPAPCDPSGFRGV
jgi:hypothetical protein